ncbi:hypothetical protein AAEO57_09790 [Flavobacterium sp. DGU38]|uniref:Uncharacterized protein n=1 Tax=Flavobacterium calami TaxID=3139144 RepID=A0ABU9IPC5_9FLAO
MKDMTQPYLLEWLDSVVTLNLNPKKSDVSKLTPLQSKAIINKAMQETQIIQAQFTIQVFSLKKEKCIKVLVRNYHSALISLWDQLFEINDTELLDRQDLKEVAATLLGLMDELLSFVESRFSQFLTLDTRIPVSYLTISNKKTKQRLDKLRSSLFFDKDEKMLVDIVFNILYCFVNSKKKSKITFREMLYHKQLIKELELLKRNKSEDLTHTGLTEVLIYMNFNTKIFINFYTQNISRKINKFEQIPDKIGWLLFYFKEFNQISSHENVALHPNNQKLKKVLSDWFKQEINFLEKKQHLTALPFPPLDKNQNQVNTEKKDEKILCQLSTDQTALILRASDELKILSSKSMNQVFKTIVPFLSTPYKNDLSYNSMRSKAYVAEERDKEIAIDTLERLIKQIKKY